MSRALFGRFTVLPSWIKSFHLDAQQQRLIRVFHVEGVETPAFGDDREIGFLPEIPDRGLDADNILRPVRLSGNQVRGTEVHIAHRRREDNVCGLVISHFQTIRRNQPVKRQLACQAVVQVPLCLHPGIGILGQFQGIAGLAPVFPFTLSVSCARKHSSSCPA